MIFESYLLLLTPMLLYMVISGNGLLNQSTGKVEYTIHTINLSNTPGPLHIPGNNHVYVPTTIPHSAGVIEVIDPISNTVVDTIGVGRNPFGISYNPNNETVYVTNLFDNTISVVDSSINKVKESIAVGNAPTGIAFNPSNNYFYVTNGRDNTISIIDSSTNEVVDTIQISNNPLGGLGGIVYNPNNESIYAVHAFDNTISIIDSSTNEVVDTIQISNNPTLGGPGAIIFNPNNNYMYLVNTFGDEISVIDSTTNVVIDTIAVGSSPISAAFNPNIENLYVLNHDENTISVIDSITNNVVDTIAVGNGPSAITFNPSNGAIYVGNEDDDTISVILTAANASMTKGGDVEITRNEISQPTNGNISMSNCVVSNSNSFCIYEDPQRQPPEEGSVGPPISGITVDTDKKMYMPGEEIEIFGTLDQIVPGAPLRIDVFDSTGDIIEEDLQWDFIVSSATGVNEFSVTQSTQSLTSFPGNYRILVTYGDEIEETTFMVSAFFE